MSDDAEPRPAPIPIADIWVYVGIAANGDERVLSVVKRLEPLPAPMLMPLIATSEAVRDKMRPDAIALGRQQRMPVKCVKLSRVEIEDVFALVVG